MEYTKREKELIRFFNKYGILNREERKEVACYVNSMPYSWNVVYLELVNKTKMSMEMLKVIVSNNFLHPKRECGLKCQKKK